MQVAIPHELPDGDWAALLDPLRDIPGAVEVKHCT